MPNLAALLEASSLYLHAYSPAIATMHSMPRFFYQSGPGKIPHTLLADAKGHYWSPDRTLFDVLDEAWGKPRIAVGYGLDYREMLSNHVDHAESVASCHGDRITAGIPGKAKAQFLTQLAWLKSLPFFSQGAARRVFSPIIKEYAFEVVQRNFETAADSNVRGIIGLFHYPLPHRPFVWRDGRRMPRFPDDAHIHTVKNYMDNLQGVDFTLGDIISKMKQTGRYDAATIVLMSDHSWKQDPDDGVPGNRDEAVVQNFDAEPRHRWKHIPLIIKWPFQNRGEVAVEEVFTSELGKFLNSKLQENEK